MEDTQCGCDRCWLWLKPPAPVPVPGADVKPHASRAPRAPPPLLLNSHDTGAATVACLPGNLKTLQVAQVKAVSKELSTAEKQAQLMKASETKRKAAEAVRTRKEKEGERERERERTREREGGGRGREGRGRERGRASARSPVGVAKATWHRPPCKCRFVCVRQNAVPGQAT